MALGAFSSTHDSHTAKISSLLSRIMSSMTAAFVVAPPAFSEPSRISDRRLMAVERALELQLEVAGPGFISMPAIRSSKAITIDEKELFNLGR